VGEKIIGILGGMGPEATLNCFAKILSNTPAEKDQDHIRVIIDNNPKIPDRTGAINGTGESPVDAVVQSSQALKNAGADFIIIPCVTVHYFYDQFSKASPLPILSILDVVAQAIKAEYPDMKKIGLMATNGTVQTDIFQKRLAKENIETIVCDDNCQEQVMQAIYSLKSSPTPEARQQITATFQAAAKSLVQAGAQGIVAGCTEIPLALSQDHLDVPYFDALNLLARAAIRQAGREPK
jgi:aspartate racemase